MAVSVGGDSSEPMVEPNVIPLVDIMLVLLIIFIITIPVMTKPENINLSIDFDGTIYWNESMIDRTKLLNYVLQEAVKDPQPEIHIRADRRVRYEYVAEVLFNLQRGGLMKIGFIAEPPGKAAGG
jgi:biopolymer transport protein ExbD